MDEIKQAEFTNALNAYAKAESLTDEEVLLMVLEYAKTLSRRFYVKSKTL